MTFRSSSRSRAAQYARWNEVRRRTGYRSQFEADIAASLEGTGAAYESARLPYSVTTTATYTPDWILPGQCRFVCLSIVPQFGEECKRKLRLLPSGPQKLQCVCFKPGNVTPAYLEQLCRFQLGQRRLARQTVP